LRLKTHGWLPDWKGANINRVIEFIKANWKMLLIWLFIIAAILVGLMLHIDTDLIAVFVVVFGVIANAFSGLMALIGAIPIVGPIIVKVLSMPILWILNAIGYYISVLAIKKGYKKEVLNHRVLTVVFLAGFTIGFVIARLI